MLTNKSVSPVKSKVSVAAKALSKNPVVRAASFAGSPNKVTESQAVYSAREQRLRSERSLFSVLLAPDDFTSDFSRDMDVVNLVHNRLPLSVIDRLLAEGVSKQEINLVAPQRTLAHRRANEERLTIDESDRAVRLARVVAQTESVFGNKGKAMAWLRQPMKRFEGLSPIEMLVTDVGSRMVEEALVQIDEGFFA
jgi:putative toxin-antitoxin system antitoxin component (TIGR02293 family)